MTAPALTGPDALIAALLAQGYSVDQVAEIGIYRGTRKRPAWTRDDVLRMLRARAAQATAAEAEPAGPAHIRLCRCQRPTVPWQPSKHGDPPLLVVITRTQADVLEALCDGLDAPGVRAHLGITDSTLRTHVKRLLAAFGVSDRAQMVALALNGRVVFEVGDARPGMDVAS
jgi:DNA-binding CsgD family transcriptional regulator